MISVANLLANNRIPGNYFASDVYVHSDLEMGLLENRRGDRLLALPETFLQAIHAGLEKETGQASSLVLMNCGRWWGKNFYARFCEEVSDYYEKPLAEMPMVELLQCLRQCWTTHGWGKIDLDHTYQQHGFLVIKIYNSPFITSSPKAERPVGFLEMGILSSFFSQLTGRDLHCVQTSCQSQSSDSSYFVLGLAKRLEPVEKMVMDGKPHEAIMQSLCA
jgi:predicted hydrocarbon binding protein